MKKKLSKLKRIQEEIEILKAGDNNPAFIPNREEHLK
jgi:hypothetical protein